jgi:predicted transcriptional regulator
MDDAKPDLTAPGVMDEQALFDPEEPGIFDELDEAAERAAVVRAEADVAAGRVVPHDDAVKWFESFGTDDQLPRPQPWRK